MRCCTVCCPECKAAVDIHYRDEARPELIAYHLDLRRIDNRPCLASGMVPLRVVVREVTL